MNLLRMNLCSTFLILLVLIIRYFLLIKLPRKTFLFLWNIVLLHLAIPYPIKIRLNDLKIAKGLTKLIMNADGSTLNKLKIPNEHINILKLYSISELIKSKNDLVPIFLKIAWLIGVFCCTTYFLIHHIKYRLKYNQALPYQDEYVDISQFSLSMKRTIKLKVSDRILSPLTYGIFRPVILIPSVMKITDENQLKYVITHELVHIKQFDVVITWLFTTILCIHWFNPFVWIMYILVKRDIEVNCDEKVIKIHGVEVKNHYANTLLLLEEKKSKLISESINFSVNPIEERIVFIMKTKKTLKSIIYVPVIIFFILIATLMKVDVNAYEGIGNKNDFSNITVPEIYGKSIDEAQLLLDIYDLAFYIE